MFELWTLGLINYGDAQPARSADSRIVEPYERPSCHCAMTTAPSTRAGYMREQGGSQFTAKLSQQTTNVRAARAVLLQLRRSTAKKYLLNDDCVHFERGKTTERKRQQLS